MEKELELTIIKIKNDYPWDEIASYHLRMQRGDVDPFNCMTLAKITSEDMESQGEEPIVKDDKIIQPKKYQVIFWAFKLWKIGDKPISLRQYDANIEMKARNILSSKK